MAEFTRSRLEKKKDEEITRKTVFLGIVTVVVFVALIVLGVSYRLGKRTFDDLVDKAPIGLTTKISVALKSVPEVTRFHGIRVRVSGPDKFIELNIHVDRTLTIEEAHNVSHLVEDAIVGIISNAKVTVHVEPELGD